MKKICSRCDCNGKSQQKYKTEDEDFYFCSKHNKCSTEGCTEKEVLPYKMHDEDILSCSDHAPKCEYDGCKKTGLFLTEFAIYQEKNIHTCSDHQVECYGKLKELNDHQACGKELAKNIQYCEQCKNNYCSRCWDNFDQRCIYCVHKNENEDDPSSEEETEDEIIETLPKVEFKKRKATDGNSTDENSIAKKRRI